MERGRGILIDHAGDLPARYVVKKNLVRVI